MGCSCSGDNSADKGLNVSFEKVGISEVDAFFTDAEEILKSLAEICETV